MVNSYAIRGLNVTKTELTIFGLSAHYEEGQWNIGLPTLHGYQKSGLHARSIERSFVALRSVVESDLENNIFAVSNRTVIKLYAGGHITIQQIAKAIPSTIETRVPYGKLSNHMVIHLSITIAGRKIALVIFDEDTIGQDVIMPLNKFYQPV